MKCRALCTLGTHSTTDLYQNLQHRVCLQQRQGEEMDWEAKMAPVDSKRLNLPELKKQMAKADPSNTRRLGRAL